MMDRRRALLSSGAESGPVWLYNRGVTSGIIGGWNTVGYRYGAQFDQAEEPESLRIFATSSYNNRGGRTYTSNNILPSDIVGKTLHVKGYFEMRGSIKGGRDSYVHAFISDSVQDVSNVESALNSGAFAGQIHISQVCTPGTSDIKPGKTRDFEMILPLTKTGFLSLVFYKGYNGLLYSYFTEVWIE